MNAREIMEKDVESKESVLVDFLKGIASCDYYDGTSHQLYLDLSDNSFLSHQEASDSSWLQRDDGSLVQIYSVSGYCDTPEEERYTDGCDLLDYGYAEWMDAIEDKINEALTRVQA